MLLAACALLLGSSALLGMQFSGASWTDTSDTGVNVAAATDWTPPTVAMTDPGAGVTGTATLAATATDAISAVASVDLQYRISGGSAWTTLCTDTTSPYSCPWDTTTVADGDYVLRATALDTAGVLGTSLTVPTQVMNTAGVTLSPVASPVAGAVTLTGTFANAGSATVDMYLEYVASGGTTWTTLCGPQAVTTLSCTWTTAGSGKYDVRVRAVARGKTFTAVQTGIVVDNVAPTASLSVPAGVLSGTVVLAATAADTDSSVASVVFEYRLQGAPSWTTCGTVTTAPYSCSLDTTTVGDGTYDFRARATDAVGNATTTAVQSRSISNAAGSVSITSPADGSTVGGPLTVSASASSGRGVASVRIDARPAGGTWAELCTDTTAPYSCSWAAGTLPGGSYQLRAVMAETYGGGTLTSGTTTVTVNNSVGTVTVTSPTAGSTVSGTVSVAASAVSATGVTSVQLQSRPAGGVFSTFCTDTTAPYSCAWDTSSIVYGGYEVQAVMTQGNTIVATSSVVGVSVNNVVGSVSISSPAAGNVRGIVNLSANATSNAGVTSVGLETRTTPSGAFSTFCTDTTAPYTCAWDTSAITYGTYETRAVMTQGNGSTLTSAAVALTVDNRVLGGADVQANDQAGDGAPNGTASNGDRIRLTFSGLADLTTIKAGWTGAATPVTLNFKDKNVAALATDVLMFTGANLGSVTFSQKYVAPNKTVNFAGTMTATTIMVSGAPVTVVTVTVGAIDPASNAADLSTLNTAQNPGTLTWTPSAAVKDLFGTATTTTAATETGTTDGDL